MNIIVSRQLAWRSEIAFALEKDYYPYFRCVAAGYMMAETRPASCFSQLKTQSFSNKWWYTKTRPEFYSGSVKKK
jgi:hypothetical protein